MGKNTTSEHNSLSPCTSFGHRGSISAENYYARETKIAPFYFFAITLYKLSKPFLYSDILAHTHTHTHTHFNKFSFL